jgi:hypothetical protein
MLRHHAVFDRLAAEFAVTTLLGSPPAGALARLASNAPYEPGRRRGAGLTQASPPGDLRRELVAWPAPHHAT